MRAFGIINNAWRIITEYPYKTYEEAKKEVDELNREDFLNVKIAMPLIARGVSREEKKHGKKNRINLYHEYLTYLGNIGDD